MLDLSVYTAQSLFDKVAAHLLKQNARAVTPINWCTYRNQAGLACAAGCLLPDEMVEKMSPDMKVKSWRALVDGHIVSEHHETLIGSLQRIHDLSPSQDWRLELKHLAAIRGLDFNV